MVRRIPAARVWQFQGSPGALAAAEEQAAACAALYLAAARPPAACAWALQGIFFSAIMLFLLARVLNMRLRQGRGALDCHVSAMPLRSRPWRPRAVPRRDRRRQRPRLPGTGCCRVAPPLPQPDFLLRMDQPSLKLATRHKVMVAVWLVLVGIGVGAMVEKVRPLPHFSCRLLRRQRPPTHSGQAPRAPPASGPALHRAPRPAVPQCAMPKLQCCPALPAAADKHVWLRQPRRSAVPRRLRRGVAGVAVPLVWDRHCRRRCGACCLPPCHLHCLRWAAARHASRLLCCPAPSSTAAPLPRFFPPGAVVLVAIVFGFLGFWWWSVWAALKDHELLPWHKYR